ncbi:hypothetical protein MUK42_37583 [Musa troglodytarum]|uniref:Uncharacterized protein n=1 Tax=Musa troglodytarum TaxID=320322 RepID=A0A9E7FBB1_9LILI|nr:hypothetical protein MUK42_37583 [Musa troglodytarum]
MSAICCCFYPFVSETSRLDWVSEADKGRVGIPSIVSRTKKSAKKRDGFEGGSVAFETRIVFPRGMGEDARLLASFIIRADSTEITVDRSRFASLSHPISSFLFFLVEIHVPNPQTTIGKWILGGISRFVFLIFLSFYEAIVSSAVFLVFYI